MQLKAKQTCANILMLVLRAQCKTDLSCWDTLLIIDGTDSPTDFEPIM